LPESMGLGYTEAQPTPCRWPVHTLTKNHVNEFGRYYTRVHIQSPYDDHSYTLGDMFKVWGIWKGYERPLYFQADGVSFYRSANVELLIHRGPVINPDDNVYSQTTRNYEYGDYAPQDGDWIEILVHEPYRTEESPT